MARKLAFAAILIAAVAAAPAAAAEQRCLSKTEQRAAIAGGQAITLSAAMKAARGVSARAPQARPARGAREVVRARLCRGPEGLVYVLTVLARDGKVTRTTVDARSGKVVEAR